MEMTLRWQHLVAVANGRTLVGMDGVRDPEGPCEMFENGPLHGGTGDCETDGHYLCDECVHRATCEGCRRRPSQCECVDEDELVEQAIRDHRHILESRADLAVLRARVARRA